jgi:hypothetical protein
MPRTANPLDLWQNSVQIGMIMAEAQWVIGLRMMGMAGMWSVKPSENSLMVTEKSHAMTRSLTNAGLAAMSGKNGDQILAAALKPIRQKTRANASRLIKRGPKLN